MPRIYSIIAPILISLAGSGALGQSPPSETREPGIYRNDGRVDLVLGFPLRRLPFRLALNPSEPPRSLREFVDKIAQALPEARLRMFAAYYGGREFARQRRRYRSTVDFWRDLYVLEILDEANRIWWPTGETRLLRAQECVGRTFRSQVEIQIGQGYLETHGSDDTGAAAERNAGYREAYLISMRLFEICDRLR